MFTQPSPPSRIRPNAALATPTGWPLLPVPNEPGQMHYPTVADSVRQSIEIILRTRPGEQLMRPNFGGGLENFLQQPNTLVPQRRIQSAITDSLTRWEPRILLRQVSVEPVTDAPTHIRIEIFYQLKRTGLAQQMGLTMELEG